MSHLFSGMLLDTEKFKNETIVCMAVDGSPDMVLDSRDPEFWYAGCLSRRSDLTFAPVESPGPLFTAASTIFRLEPGSLMALASASRAAIDFDIESAVASLRLRGGRIAPWPAAFSLLKSLAEEAEQQLAKREPDSGFTWEENVQSAVMKHVQRAAELIAIRNVELICGLGEIRTEDAYLSMPGGFGLNCPTNTMLLDRFRFRGLLTPPCANDSGQAIGLGLLGLYGIGAFEDSAFRLESAYCGMPLVDVEDALHEFAPWIESVSPFDPGQFVADISGSILAWVDGCAEIGPRALGHRSLLGDPRSMKVKGMLNCCKQRQWWRPVAPIVLAEYANEWFEQQRPSPFMLEAATVRPCVSDKVPAVLHLDGSARHQTLSAMEDPLLHHAIEVFRSETGVPLLCNTSLNDKGEPIVNSVAEALTFCVSKDIQVAYISGSRVVLRREPVPAVSAPDRPRTRAVEYFAGQEQVRDALWDSWRRRGYSDSAILLLAGSSSLSSVSSDQSSEVVNELAKYYMETDDYFASMIERFREETGPGSFFIPPGEELPRPVVGE
jgi:hypothetical protein